jgi:hypothetical protein
MQSDHLLGSWFYYSGGYVEGKPRPLRECRLSVKRGLFSPYVGYSYFPVGNKSARFKSRISVESGRVIEQFRTIDGKNSGYCAFSEPTSPDDMLFGFWMSSNIGDVHKLLSCGVTVLSRHRIPLDECREIVRTRYEYHGDIPSMIRLRASVESPVTSPAHVPAPETAS